ncbi:MAG: ABC transporter permease [Candidatus Kariarchaeaceae archaeon]|jgi:thiamine transport system permease protein
MSGITKRLSPLFLALPSILFLVIFFYWPLSKIIELGLQNSLSQWCELFSSVLFRKFLIFTLIQSILTVIGSVLIGLPTGLLLARGRPHFQSLLRSAITVPFLFPPLAILLGFVVLFGRNGFVNEQLSGYVEFDPFSFWGIVAAHLVYNVSVIARISESAFMNEPEEFHTVAISLGASKWMRFRTITFPHIQPAVEAGVLLVFLYSFNSFAIVLILGEVKLQTIEVMIYNQSQLHQNYEKSAMLVIIQLIVNLSIVMIYAKRRSYLVLEGTRKIETPVLTRKVATTIISIVIILTWAPIIIILSKTFSGIRDSPGIFRQQLFSGSYDRLLGTSSLRVLVNTLFFGLVVAVLALVLSGFMIAATQFLSNPKSGEKLFLPLTLIPMGTSAITISLGLLLTHGRNQYFSDLVWIYIIAAQLIAALPFASRVLFSSWERVPKDLILVSNTLGANRWQTFEKVILPYMKSAILVAVLFSFAISIGEFGATFFLSRGEWVTLSIAIKKMFISRNIVLPYIYALILVLTSLMTFLIIEKIGSLEMRL